MYNQFSKILLLILISIYSSLKAQTIEVLNIPTTFGDRNVSYAGFSLEGNQLDYARIKLLETANFGTTGTIQNSLNITSGFSDLNSITSVGQLNSYDIIFIGSVFNNNGSFTESEINILKAWSAQEKKVLIIAEQPLASPISNAFGFPESDGNQDPTTATIEDSNRNVNIFSGPFGNVSQITQAGSSQGYFSSNCVAPALARNANGEATILYDTTYNDILIADTGFFQDSQMQNNTSINNNSEIAWANLWAWAVREVLTGVIPVTGNNEGQTSLISSSPTCEGSEVIILVSDNLGSIITWETSIDDGASWTQIASTSNPLIYDNAVDGQKFRAVTSVDPICSNYFTSETTVNVVTNPTANQPIDMHVCDDINNDGIGLFNLTDQNSSILNSQSADDFSVRYFTNAARTDEIIPVDLIAFNNTSNPQEIFVRVENNISLCTNDDVSFELFVNILPLAHQPEDLVVCVDSDSANFGNFNLVSQNSAILGSQSATDFTIRYFRDVDRLDEIIGLDLTNFNNSSNPQEIYVRLENNNLTCVDDNISFSLVVNLLPEVEIEDQYVICLDSDENIIDPINSTFLSNPPIDTQLNEAEYMFEWYVGSQVINSNLIIGATNSSFTPSNSGDYTVVVTNIFTQCAVQATTTVIASYPPESITIEQITEPFSENNAIEVSVTGNGTYEYSLNSQPWQSSNIFYNVTGCDNIVYVRDLINCNEISESINIIDYPLFFTPNGDGQNDTWNIECKSSLSNAKIFIFDRYGKLLKQFYTYEIGWDGTFNGKRMPTNDYWFSIEYDKPVTHIKKQFRAHFTLKR